MGWELLGALMITTSMYVLNRLDQPQGLSPDGQQYLRMAAGLPSPIPYNLRWLMPSLLKRQSQWVWMSAVALMLSGPLLMACLPEQLSYSQKLLAVALWAGLPWFRVNVRLPVLTDAPAMTLALLVALISQHSTTPVSLCAILILSLLAGAVNEKGPIFAAALTMSPIPLVGLIGTGWFRIRTSPKGSEAWLQHPWREATKAHRGWWFHWQMMLLPWGMLALLAPVGWMAAGWEMRTMVALNLALGYGMVLRSQDWARLFQWAAPAVIVMSVGVVPDWACLLVGLVHVMNPYRGV